MSVPSPLLAGTDDDLARRFFDDLAPATVGIAASAAERDAQRRYPTAEYDALRQVGFWRLPVPAEYGGLGLDHDALVTAVIEVAAADGSLGQIPQNHFSTLERLRLQGSPAQQARIYAKVGAGAVLGNASAEPRERPPGEAETRVTLSANGYRLTGRKVYSTGALLADLIAVQARDDGGEQVFVLIDRHAPGVDVIDDWSGFGQRTTASGSAVLDDVPVETLDILRTGTDPRPRYRVSAHAQLLHCAIDTGIAEGALRAAVRLAGHVHGGRGSHATDFADDTLGVARLGELWIAVEGARALVQRSAQRLDALTAASPLEDVLAAFYGVAAAKSVSTDAALTVTSALIDIGGASSTHTALSLDRHWRDARTHTVHDSVRWKPYAIGRRLISGDVADAWSYAHPFTPYDRLEVLR
ncbi:acyl-CoA dehydrogenase family protein [Mycobacterium sp. 21AC1]|uniref:acyl-CoA dehydrogenase family protein n=1 Tax=[Mycobacterium] appelbergii TaxID=2939269 RepID=UPI002938F454|nr:acyl-CoA dehydrogenase family protein [Mycobacterium sp. 21AC1]MDV3124996.1 acyl-CoA dehydrogenase family protein [Mycobacterium sp. 21AC1]